MSQIEFEEVTEASVSLPFEDNKQLAVLGHLLENNKFFTQALDRILPKWFHSAYAQRILKAKIQFFKDFGRCPTIAELLNVREFMVEEQRVVGRIRDCVRLAQAYSLEYGLDALARELTDWSHSHTYQTAVRKSVQLYNNKKPREAYKIIEDALFDIKFTSFEDSKEETFTSYVDDFEQNQIEYSNALTFGLSQVDKLLTPKAKAGSLLVGDTSVILAPTNTGKTTCMISIIRHNLWLGKHILFITHEGRPSDIKEKLWCAMLECTTRELYDMYATVEGRTRIETALLWMKRFITYVPLNKAGMTVEEVESIVRKRCEERKMQNGGRGYDMLVNDYPAKLTTEQARGGHFSKRNIDEVVYGRFIQLGLEYKMHVLCAIQTNREGSKVNKGQKEDRLLTLEDVLESWGPMTEATNVWTINRSPRDKIANRLIYHIDKSRSSETGYAVVCKTDYGRSITHSDKLGCTYYQGCSTYADKLDKYLEQYIGNKIPDSILYA